MIIRVDTPVNAPIKATQLKTAVEKQTTAPGSVAPTPGKTDASTGLQAQQTVPQANRQQQAEKTTVQPKEPYACKTCENRRYQDQSTDAGVSMKTPTQLAPQQAASAVAAHEQEHVTREQQKAKEHGRDVLMQSVTLHVAICPECGKPYVSGGETKTVTASPKQSESDRYSPGQPETQPSIINANA